MGSFAYTPCLAAVHVRIRVEKGLGVLFTVTVSGGVEARESGDLAAVHEPADGAAASDM